MSNAVSNQELTARWQGALMNNYGTPRLPLVRGEGAKVWDARTATEGDDGAADRRPRVRPGRSRGSPRPEGVRHRPSSGPRPGPRAVVPPRCLEGPGGTPRTRWVTRRRLSRGAVHPGAPLIPADPPALRCTAPRHPR
ncbi:hypothetical protein SGRIM128S_04798 [Streptomyces griseomycini]